MTKGNTFLNSETIYPACAFVSFLGIAYSPDPVNNAFVPVSIVGLASVPNFLSGRKEDIFFNRCVGFSVVFVASLLGTDLNCENPVGLDAARICCSNSLLYGLILGATEGASYILEKGISSAVDKSGELYRSTMNYLFGGPRQGGLGEGGR